MNEQDIERILHEIFQTESETSLVDKVGESFQDILDRITADGIPAEQIISGVKHGLGVAFGHHLGVLTLERLAKASLNLEESPSWEMSVGLPEAYINEVQSAWPELKARLEQEVGFSPTNLKLEVDEDWTVRQGGMILAQRDLPRDWFEPLVAYLSRWMHAFLTLDEVNRRLTILTQKSPAIAQVMAGHGISLSVIHEVLQLVLAESVPIAELDLMMIRILAGWPRTHDPIALAELAREAVSPWLCRRYQYRPGYLQAICLSEELDLLNETIAYQSEDGLYQYFPPRHVIRLRQTIRAALERLEGCAPLILFTDRLSRPALGAMCAKHFPELGVLAWNEIHAGFEVEILATLDLE